jgi:hypothetical protein
LQEFKGGSGVSGGKKSKEQLKEMLAILNEGPRRPSPLDKPAVTAVAAAQRKSSNPGGLAGSALKPHMSGQEVDQLLGVIGGAEESRCAWRMGPTLHGGMEGA